MTQQTLYSITQDILALDQLLTECDGDISSPQVEEAFDQFSREIEVNLNDKVDNYAALIKELEARSAARRNEAKRLADLAARDEQKAAYLTERLHATFKALSLPPIETARFKVAVVGKGGKQRLEVDEDMVPVDYCKMVVAPDNELIRSALEGGEALPFARLAERGTRLSIR